MWSVVTESPIETRQRAPAMSSTVPGLERHAVEVRRQPHVRRVGIPGEELALRDREVAPGVVAGEDVGVDRAEHLLADRSRDRLAHLLGRGPDVGEEHVLAVGARLRSARSRDRGPCARRARRRPRAAARRGSSPSPPGECGPRSCGCPRAPRRRRGPPATRPARSPPGAGPSSRCTSCSRTRRCGSRAPRGTA